MPTSYEVDTFLGEVDTFFQKKTLYLPTKELLGNIPKNRIGKRQYIFLKNYAKISRIAKNELFMGFSPQQR